MPVRRYRSDDLPALYRANVASVPGVGEETQDSLARWIGLSTCFVATDADDAPLGFITLIATGTLDYPSANLRWLEAYSEHTGRSLIYVDRIALLPEARGQGMGETLYRTAFDHFCATDDIGCEVNIAPPNPGSHRFHQRLGFVQVGERSFADGEKAVAYYVRPLDTPAPDMTPRK